MTSNDPRSKNNLETESDEKPNRINLDEGGDDRKGQTSPSHQAGYAESDGVTQRREAQGNEDSSTIGTP